MKLTASERITKMLEMAHTDDAVFSPTELYKEGWMLRIILSTLSEGLKCPPFTFQTGARWFSEAELTSPFHLRRGERKRDGERKRQRSAEGPTSLDGVIGHFDIRPGTKVGFQLTEDATQFLVVEAKMFSSLSKKVKYAEGYDQAARTVACMAWTIGQSDRSVSDFDSLGFYITAPHEQIFIRDEFSPYVKKSSIREKVEKRVNDYVDKGEIYEELRMWYNDSFIPTLEHIDIDCISWKDLIDRIDDDSIRDFYKRCRQFNRKGK